MDQGDNNGEGADEGGRDEMMERKEVTTVMTRITRITRRGRC